MSVYQRGNVWWVELWDARAKRRVHVSAHTPDREKAVAVESVLKMAYAGKEPAAMLHALIDQLCGSRASKLPLAGLWSTYSAWLETSNKQLSVLTVRKRRNAVDNFVAWAKDKWPAARHLEDVDRPCAAAFANRLAKRGGRGKTRYNILADLGTTWEGLKRIRDGIDNPWPLVLPETSDSERRLPFSRDQEAAILKAADARGLGWGLACRIARHTGLRYGDIALLRWSSVDLDAGVISVAPSKTARHGIDVQMPLCLELLQRMRSARATDVTGEFVLPDHSAAYPRPDKGTPGSFVSLLADAGLVGTPHTFHSWRHTFRTRLAEVGVSDEIARRLGGWTQAATEQRYDHAARLSEMRQAVEASAASPAS